MFDFSHLPQNAVVSEYVLKPGGGSAFQKPSCVWHKPPNVRLIFMMAIGGGGGGGGGSAGLVGTSRSGGGGGGSGAITQALFLASSLPSTIHIWQSAFPTSGMGAASASNATAGVTLYISNYTGSNTSASLAAYIYSAGGSGGNFNSAGLGGSATSSTNAALLNHSIYWTSIAGRIGTYAGAGLPANTSIGTASPILGGAGGGGVLTGVPTVFNGAGFASEIPAILPDIAGGTASSALDASSGVRLPFLSVGGAGGGANDNGPGGRGGNGIGYGAGGGGGGAGITGQGGRGGDGGPAYACIIAW